MLTPIADTFAHNRAVAPDAMALIRQLERERAQALILLAMIGRADAEAVASLEHIGHVPDEFARSLGRQAREMVARYKLTEI